MDIEENSQPAVSCNSERRTLSSNTTSKCKFCGKNISKKNIKRHENQCSNNETKLQFECPTCKRAFSRDDKLKEHCQKHETNMVNTSQRRYISCMYAECNFSFITKTSLIEHLKIKHECSIEQPKIITFNNIEEFEKWKDEEEERSFSYYSKQRGKKKYGDNEFIYFYCQHDTINTSEKSLKRKTSRKQHIGQVKTGKRCISKIHLKVKESGEYEVKYFPTHNHPLSIQDWKFQPQAKSVNKFIDQQISLNVSPTKIVQSLQQPMTIDERDDASNKKLTKAQLITRNLVRLRALKKRIAKRYHEDDATSVLLMAKAMKDEDPSSVLIYKPLGQNCVDGPEGVNNLPNADKLFMFGFQTKAQRELIVKENSILIIDETHATNQYGYRLLTCLVRDDNNSGWPVAHLITSRSDGETLKYFFESLKQKCPEMTVNCLITDDDGALINGVMAGFQDNSIRHILCKWHLHKNWKAKLRELASKDLVHEMYLGLIFLSESNNIEEFKNLSEGFKRKYSIMAPKFVEYFEKEYLNSEDRIMKWANCYQNYYHGNVNTTGHAESFHNRLKTIYLKRKPNKRIDDLIQILLGIENDDYWRRKRNNTFGITRSFDQRHSKGLAIPDSCITFDQKGQQWIIKSSRNESRYNVKKLQEKCFNDLCFFMCSAPSCYNLCSHLYICTCPDENRLCKHIHKVRSLEYRELLVVPVENEAVVELHTSSNPPVVSDQMLLCLKKNLKGWQV